MINTENLNWIHRRRKRTKNDELEALLESSWESPDKNIDRKEWRDFTRIKRYLIKKSESLKKKGGRAGKQIQLGRGNRRISWSENSGWNHWGKKAKLRTNRMDTRLRTPIPRRRRGGQVGKENNWGLNSKMKRLESTWREMHRMKRAEEQRSENQLRDPKEKFEREEE